MSSLCIIIRANDAGGKKMLEGKNKKRERGKHVARHARQFWSRPRLATRGEREDLESRF